MAESPQSDNGLSAADYADLQHIGSQLPQNHPVRAKIDRVLSASQPNAGLAGPAAPPAIPQPKPLSERLTEIEKPDPTQRWSPMEAMKAVGNVGAGAMTPIVHPVDTLAGVGGLITAPFEKMAGSKKPTVYEDMYHGAKENPYGMIESGIGQAATLKGADEIPPETAAAPVRGVVRGLNAAKRNAPAIGAGLGAIGGAGELATKGSPYGLLYMPYVGERLGKFVQKAPDIPGENLGKPTPFAGGRFEPSTEPMKGTPSGPPPGVGSIPPRETYPSRGPIQGPQQENVATGPMKADTSKLGPPAGVGKYQPPERVPPPVRTAPIERAPEPVAETAKPQVSMADQIATAKGLGFKNLGDAINRFGFEGWQKILGQEQPTPEPVSVRPGSPTPFHNDAPLTPRDLGIIKNTNIPTWEEVERQGNKERFYAEAPMVKTKNQLVNEVQPSMVAKSEANTSPYNLNLPTKKIRR